MDQGVVKSASRTIRILSIFEEVRSPKKAAEISKKMSIPLSSCVALLDTLVTEGVLSYDFKVREYFPTRRVKQLGSWLDAADFLSFTALAAARRVGGLLGCNWALAKVNGSHVKWDASAGGGEVALGARLPLCASPAGLAILSLRANDQVAYAIHEHNRQASWDHVEHHKVVQNVSRIAQQGFALGLSGRHPTSHALAIGLRSPDGSDELALCIFMSELRFVRSREHILRTVRGCLATAFGEDAAFDGPLPMVA
jgi:DNA-binding IclR family transcriptional regulator